jgi:hypothetical protein
MHMEWVSATCTTNEVQGFLSTFNKLLLSANSYLLESH